jgi:DNA-binding transcriptional ArsR family regulator
LLFLHDIFLRDYITLETVNKLLWWLLAGSRGGDNRIRLLTMLRERPLNTNQLREELDLDYKTVQHHLRVLTKNRVIVEEGDRYGRLFFLTPWLEANWEVVEEIMAKSGKNNK